MKKIIALFLVCVMILTACSPATNINIPDVSKSEEASQNVDKEDDNEVQQDEESHLIEESLDTSIEGLDDENLLGYVEDNIYSELVGELNSENYFVENIEAIYYPKEYIEALSSNTQSNVYFGYTATELDAYFEGTRYVFTLDENGQTCVVQMETLTDDLYIKALEDVIIGSGAILICVTISLVAAPAAPAVSMIFAASATTGTSFALESGALAFISAAIAKGYETENLEQAFRAGVEAAGEGFKWGAITGIVTGGESQAFKLKGATRNGLSMNDAARIQKETKWPFDAIKSLHSYDEFLIYKKAGIQPMKLSTGEWAFLREINWNLVDDAGRTNAERVAKWKLAPIDETGKSYELHHIGQKADSPLAILTWDEHHAQGNYKILHYQNEGKDVADSVWQKQKENFWKEILEKAKEQGKV